ncbi:MAG: glycosyltransferase [Chloroflexales bacterium]|nr:glycosyltransferase [Chloroflexales bacterium]
MHIGTIMPNSPYITIAVCSRNRPQQLAEWWQHICAITDSGTTPILVIDQSDTAPTLPSAPNLTIIHRPARGLAQARNIALTLATTPYIAFCDDDCRPDQDWLVAIDAAIHLEPAVALRFGAVWPSGNDYHFNHHHTHAGSTVWAHRSDGLVCTALRIAPTASHYSRPVAPLECLGQGNNMIVARAAVQQWGGFHPWLGAGAWLNAGEDVELTLRLLSQGAVCMYNPQIRLTHDSWQSTDSLTATEHGYSVGMLAVHVWYALTGMTVAREYLQFRRHAALKTIVGNDDSTKRSQSFLWARGWALAKGIVGGCCLWLTMRLGKFPNIP